MERRVSNEIKALLDKYEDIGEISVSYKKDNSKTVKIKNKTFILPKNYPFDAPKVFINGIFYHTFLKTHSLRILKILHETRRECLCCTTRLCDWTPALNMETILNEIKDMNNTKRYIKYKLCLDQLKYPKFVSYNILLFLQ